MWGATGRQENELVLDKILCNLPIGMPIDNSIVLTEGEQDMINELLKAVTQHWDALKGTSIDGLRESFLQRDGKLIIGEEQYYLQVEQKAFDVLLDRIPWNISMIRLSWMEKVLSVQWR